MFDACIENRRISNFHSNEAYKLHWSDFVTSWLRGEFKLASLFRAKENNSEYAVGSWDVRGWGYYVVTDVIKGGKDGQVVTECQKDIVVFPYQMLSLQAHIGEDMEGKNLGHEGREEIWTVIEGTLTYIQNGERKTAGPGEKIVHGAGVIHCMANMTGQPVKVHEIQKGVCQEKDNVRVADLGGRPVRDVDNVYLQKARDLYKEIMDEMPVKLFMGMQNKWRVIASRAMFLSRKVA